MSQIKKKTEQASEELKPKMAKVKKKDLSNYKLKDEHFNKTKTYIDKKSNQQKEIEADWRKINIGGLKIIAFKGEALTKAQVAKFDKAAKDFWLENIK